MTLFPQRAAAESYEAPFSAWVFEVVDGDSIMISNGSSESPSLRDVRLADIDCPEMDQAFGREAKLATEALVLHQDVIVISKGNDKYGRMLAYITLPDKRSVNEELVRIGACWSYPYSRNAQIQELQAAATHNRRGLWSGTDIEPPWEFRDKQGLEKISRRLNGEKWLKLSKRDKYLYIHGFLDGVEADPNIKREILIQNYIEVTDLAVSRASGEDRKALVGDLIRYQLQMDTEVWEKRKAELDQAPVELRGIVKQPKFSTEIFNGPTR